MKELTYQEMEQVDGGIWQALLVLIGGIGAYSSAKELGRDIGGYASDVLLSDSGVMPGADAAYSRGMAAMR